MRSIFLGQNQNKANEEPLVYLLLCRTKPNDYYPSFSNEILNNQNFNSLKSFDIQSIEEFSKGLQSNKTIREVIQMCLRSSEVDISFLNQFNTSTESPDFMLDYFCFLYQSLLWLGAPEEMQEEITYSSIFKNVNLILKFPNNVFLHPSIQIFIYAAIQYLLNESMEKDFDVLKQIIDSIYNNKDMPNNCFYVICLVLTYSVGHFDIDKTNIIAQKISKMFTTKHQAIIGANYTMLTDALEPITKRLDEKNFALMLLADASRMTDDQIFPQLFVSFPITISNFLDDFPIKNDTETILRIAEENKKNLVLLKQEEKMDDMLENGLEFPSQKIESKLLISELMPRGMYPIIARVSALGEACSPACADAMVKAMSAMVVDMKNSPHLFDFIAVILNIAMPMIGWELKGLLSQIAKSALFNPGYTIYMDNIPFDPALNTLRNTFFSMTAECDPKIFVDLLDDSVQYPFLYAEHLTRLMKILPSLPPNFFTQSAVLDSLMSSNVILTSKPQPSVMNMPLARSTFLVFIFNLLDDPVSCQSCFSHDSFASGFLSFLYEGSFSETIIAKLSRIVKSFEQLPVSIFKFISSLLTNFITICSADNIPKKSNGEMQEKVKSGAINPKLKNSLNSMTELVESLIEAMKSNNSLINNTVIPLFDIVLDVAKISKSKEMLLKAFSIVTISNSDINEKQFGNERFFKLMRVTQKLKVDLTAPICSLLNISAASTNLNTSHMFLIKNCFSLPFMLLITEKCPQKTDEVLNIILKLCEYSEDNINMCKMAQIDSILLDSLMGPFEFKHKTFTLSYQKDKTNLPIYLILSKIFSFTSDDNIIKKFLRFIVPSNDKSILQNASLFLQTYIEYCTSHNQVQKFPITGKFPIFTYSTDTIDNLLENCSFFITARFDIASLIELGTDIYLFRIVDSVGQYIGCFLRHKGLYIQTVTKNTKAALQFHYNIESNHWDLYQIFIKKNKYGNLTFGLVLNGQFVLDGDFPVPELEPPFNIEIGTILIDLGNTTPPAYISHFTLAQVDTILDASAFDSYGKLSFDCDIIFTDADPSITIYNNRIPTFNDILKQQVSTFDISLILSSLSKGQSQYAATLLQFFVQTCDIITETRCEFPLAQKYVDRIEMIFGKEIVESPPPPPPHEASNSKHLAPSRSRSSNFRQENLIDTSISSNDDRSSSISSMSFRAISHSLTTSTPSINLSPNYQPGSLNGHQNYNVFQTNIMNSRQHGETAFSLAVILFVISENDCFGESVVDVVFDILESASQDHYQEILSDCILNLTLWSQKTDQKTFQYFEMQIKNRILKVNSYAVTKEMFIELLGQEYYVSKYHPTDILLRVFSQCCITDVDEETISFILGLASENTSTARAIAYAKILTNCYEYDPSSFTPKVLDYFLYFNIPNKECFSIIEHLLDSMKDDESKYIQTSISLKFYTNRYLNDAYDEEKGSPTKNNNEYPIPVSNPASSKRILNSKSESSMQQIPKSSTPVPSYNSNFGSDLVRNTSQSTYFNTINQEPTLLSQFIKLSIKQSILSKEHLPQSLPIGPNNYVWPLIAACNSKAHSRFICMMISDSILNSLSTRIHEYANIPQIIIEEIEHLFVLISIIDQSKSFDTREVRKDLVMSLCLAAMNEDKNFMELIPKEKRRSFFRDLVLIIFVMSLFTFLPITAAEIYRSNLFSKRLLRVLEDDDSGIVCLDQFNESSTTEDCHIVSNQKHEPTKSIPESDNQEAQNDQRKKPQIPKLPSAHQKDEKQIHFDDNGNAKIFKFVDFICNYEKSDEDKSTLYISARLLEQSDQLMKHIKNLLISSRIELSVLLQDQTLNHIYSFIEKEDKLQTSIFLTNLCINANARFNPIAQELYSYFNKIFNIKEKKITEIFHFIHEESQRIVRIASAAQNIV